MIYLSEVESYRSSELIWLNMRDMRDMGEKKRRHGGHHVHGGVGFGLGGVGGHHAAEHDEKHREPKKLDMSGMSMDTIPHLSMPLGNITTLDLSNNNLEVEPFNFLI
jgi:hypothetical protein